MASILFTVLLGMVLSFIIFAGLHSGELASAQHFAIFRNLELFQKNLKEGWDCDWTTHDNRNKQACNAWSSYGGATGGPSDMIKIYRLGGASAILGSGYTASILGSYKFRARCPTPSEVGGGIASRQIIVEAMPLKKGSTTDAKLDPLGRSYGRDGWIPLFSPKKVSPDTNPFHACLVQP